MTHRRWRVSRASDAGGANTMAPEAEAAEPARRTDKTHFEANGCSEAFAAAADVELRVGGVKLPAHSHLLRLHSPVLGQPAS